MLLTKYNFIKSVKTNCYDNYVTKYVQIITENGSKIFKTK